VRRLFSNRGRCWSGTGVAKLRSGRYAKLLLSSGKRPTRMPKLTATFLLPLAQILLAATLLAWGHSARDPMRLDTMYVPTATLVCYGINAPIMLVRPIIGLVTRTPAGHAPISILGFGLDEIVFLIAVVPLWYFAARQFAEFRERKMGRPRARNAVTSLWPVINMVVGASLFLLGIASMRTLGRWNNPTGNMAESALFILWAFVLLFLAGSGLIGLSHRRESL